VLGISHARHEPGFHLGTATHRMSLSRADTQASGAEVHSSAGMGRTSDRPGLACIADSSMSRGAGVGRWHGPIDSSTCPARVVGCPPRALQLTVPAGKIAGCSEDGYAVRRE
jgi:hypothetical protein